MICPNCGRLKATQEDYDTIPEGEGGHLCWGEWDEDQCDPSCFKRDQDRLYAIDLLRAGLDIPESIPACASVPRGSIRFGYPVVGIENEDDRKRGITRGFVAVEFTEPFTWATAEVDFPKKEKP